MVEILQLSLGLRDEPQRLGATLPERAFVTRLFAQRLVTPPARGTAVCQRTRAAARNSREADRRPEIHQRLCGRRRKPPAGAFLHTAHVRVDRKNRAAQREVPHGRGGVRPHTGEPGQIVRPTVCRDLLSCPMQVEATPVVAEPLPGSDHLRHRRRRERLNGGPALEPRQVPRDDSLDLRLLQHDLGDEDGVGISRPTPRQVAAVLREPGEQGGLHGLGL